MPLKGMSFLMTRFTRCVLCREPHSVSVLCMQTPSSPIFSLPLQPIVPPERVPRVPLRQDSSSLPFHLVQDLLVLRLARLPHRVVAVAVESRAPADGYSLQVAEVEDEGADHGSDGHCVCARAPKDASGRLPAEEWPCIADARIIRLLVCTSLRLRGRGGGMARGSALDGRGPDACRARSGIYRAKGGRKGRRRACCCRSTERAPANEGRESRQHLVGQSESPGIHGRQKLSIGFLKLPCIKSTSSGSFPL